MSRDDLAASGYLKDGTLTLQCTITVLEVLPVPTILGFPAEEAIPPPPSTNLHKHLGELLQSEAGADVTFLVCDESFAAHKNILAARSPVFKAEFFGGMKEKCSQHVEIKDMEAATFRAMLHFIYTDSVPELDQPLELAVTLAQHLLAGADRFGLDRLKVICEMKLANGITVDTAATTLALAEQHNFLQLKAKCVEFIVSTPAVLDAVLETEGYEHLAASCPSVLANLLKCARGRKH
jgi:speckle-type POZ protein